MLVVTKELSIVRPSRSTKYTRGAKFLVLIKIEGYAERFLTDSGTKNRYNIQNNLIRNNFYSIRIKRNRGAWIIYGHLPSNLNHIPIAPNPRTNPIPKINKNIDLAYIRYYRYDYIGYYISSYTAKINNTINI